MSEIGEEVVWSVEPCHVESHVMIFGKDYAHCSECGVVRRIYPGQDYGRKASQQKFYKYAVSTLGDYYLVECDRDDPERII